MRAFNLPNNETPAQEMVQIIIIRRGSTYGVTGETRTGGDVVDDIALCVGSTGCWVTQFHCKANHKRICYECLIFVRPRFNQQTPTGIRGSNSISSVSLSGHLSSAARAYLDISSEAIVVVVVAAAHPQLIQTANLFALFANDRQPDT